MSDRLLELYGKMVDNQADSITVLGELNTNIQLLNATLKNGTLKQILDSVNDTKKKTGYVMLSVLVVLVPLVWVLIKEAGG